MSLGAGRHVTRTVSLDDITPAEMACIFARWFGDEQAAFFDALAVESADWPGTGWDMQASAIVKLLSPKARRVLGSLAAHL